MNVKKFCSDTSCKSRQVISEINHLVYVFLAGMPCFIQKQCKTHLNTKIHQLNMQAPNKAQLLEFQSLSIPVNSSNES